ncbi:hypothetical protein SLS58_008086 [Diplodia intermedia]|uniref:Uncharacterized protein n=1 Tax=Diplodia intermedia TaxID=856260 RepID=A0ABR3TIJ9_9PEZI
MNLQESATSRKGPTVHGSSTSVLIAPRTNQNTLNVREAREIWEHATLLFRNYDWSEAIIHIQRLLRRSRGTPGLNHAAVWANLGILRMHLGEYYLALEAFQKAMQKAGVSVAKTADLDDGQPALVRHHQHHEAQATRHHHHHHHHPNDHLRRYGGRLDTSNTTTNTNLRNRDPRPTATAAIYPFLAGLAAYHLPRDVVDDDDDDDDDDGGSGSGSAASAGLHLARRLFHTCLSLLPPRETDGDEVKVDLRPLGLAWELERTRVVWNARICAVQAAWEEGRGELLAGRRWGVNGMPAGLCFEFVAEGR